jgi:molybdopterin adenylyltransferase
MSNRAVVITISDRCSRGEAEDLSGPTLIAELPMIDAALIHREIVPDEPDRIRDAVANWLGRCEVVLTTGGTGVAQRDITPEALRPLIERDLPGFGEVMRLRAFERVKTSVLSRGGAGIAKNTLIVYLPGSPRACKECIEWLAPATREICRFLRGEPPH